MKNFSTKSKFAGGIRRAAAGALCAAALGLAFAGSDAFAQAQEVARSTTGEHHTGKIVFLELVTPNLAASKRFYGSLLGWEFRDMDVNGARYAQASLQGDPVGGMMERAIPSGAQRQPAWLSFISVQDTDAAARTATVNGARLLFGPRDIPRRGREAILADPQGAVFAILDSSSGDPPDVQTDMGEWIWSSLITSDADAGAAFYQTLFDYDVFDLPSTGNAGGEHLMFASGNYLRASANSRPASASAMQPHWLNYIRVADAGVMAQKVVELGGTVLVGPRMDRHGGRLAVVADPQGAVFGLLEWPDSESKEVVK